MKLVRLRPPRIALVLLGLGVGLHFLVPQAYRGDFSCWACGIAGIAAGFSLMLWAWALFRRVGTPIRPTERAATLVRSGPFRVSRNPMYLGMLLMLAGVAAWVGSFPMLLPPISFLAIVSAVFIPHEEARLREIFGDDYASYARRVRRWL